VQQLNTLVGKGVNSREYFLL